MFEISNIGMFTALAGGAISFLSPCVLPLVPGYISYIAGGATIEPPPQHASSLLPRLTKLGLSFCFVLGFSTVFVLLGAGATILGQVLLTYRYELNIVGGAIVIAFGLFLTGLLKLPYLQREFRLELSIPGGRPLSAYLLGLAFAFGWTPCIGPILGSILTLGVSSQTVSAGMTLLAIYSLGLGIPFLLAAWFTDALASRLKLAGRIGRVLQIAAGMILVSMGIAMITGYLSVFAYWLLNMFPVFGAIG